MEDEWKKKNNTKTKGHEKFRKLLKRNVSLKKLYQTSHIEKEAKAEIENNKRERKQNLKKER